MNNLPIELGPEVLDQIQRHLQLMLDPTFKSQNVDITDPDILELRASLNLMDQKFMKIFDNYTHKGLADLIGNQWVGVLFLYF